MIIKPFSQKDYDKICDLVKGAYCNAKVKCDLDCLKKLFNSNDFIPKLALKSEDKGKLIGMIVLTKFPIHNDLYEKDALLLATLCVKEDYRNRGLGSILIKESFERAKSLGYNIVYLSGDPAYYQKLDMDTVSESLFAAYGLPDICGKVII